ncbi:patatin-like phospholipase family protein [Eubacterium pyruvativorans]|uniref:patatin-like phospholipase family protein n=1 Tax=Eubacterium pyruvativorans TaxID=155865 RepID=UPI0013D5F058|nr:patatin family protein [Eubacterium pyruvativorans]
MNGIIDTGGGLRDIFGAGVLDYCMEHQICFDYALGVSAGSANLVAYIAGQEGRNVHFYTEYARRKEYMSRENFFRKKNYVDLDYVYGTLSNDGGENPVDWQAYENNPIPFVVVATDAETGKPRYFTGEDIHPNDLGIIKASCTLPVVNTPRRIRGVPYYDGGVADPVPIRHALEDGCRKIVLILTKPYDYVRTSTFTVKFGARVVGRRYPAVRKALLHRAEAYNQSVAEAKKLEKQGRVLILAPNDISGLSTLTVDVDKQMALYEEGYRKAAGIRAFLDV